MKNTREKFHQLIDEIDNQKLLEHFYILLSNLKNSNPQLNKSIKDSEYNYSEEPEILNSL